jgi:hypothetical protein
VPYPAGELDLVLLEGHSRAASVAEAAARKIVTQVIAGQLDTRRQAVEHRDQSRPV